MFYKENARKTHETILKIGVKYNTFRRFREYFLKIRKKKTPLSGGQNKHTREFHTRIFFRFSKRRSAADCPLRGRAHSDTGASNASSLARISSLPVFLRAEIIYTFPVPTPTEEAISALRFVSCARDSLSHLVAMTVNGML